MEAFRPDLPTEPQRIDPLDGPDVYDSYVAYNRAYANDLLRERKERWERRVFQKTFRILDRKKFWLWYDTLTPEDQHESREMWNLGYDEWVKRSVDQFALEVFKAIEFRPTFQ